MKALAVNKKARFEYDLKDTYEAGLVLTGAEVKAAKSGNISLTGSYVTISGDSVYLVNCHIGPYKYAPNESYDPTHTRKVLLNKKEINELIGKEKGLTIVPVQVYTTGRGLIKLTIAIARGRKKEDKREYIKERDTKRDIRREVR
jgi:SsrA-binding protein